jgi:CheY-like chemotaxis protein
VPPLVLVADDHPSLRTLVVAMLRRSGEWELVEAVDGEAALAVCRGHDVDVAILDQRMPGHQGLDVARILREEGFDGGLILFSAYLDRDAEEAAAALQVATLHKSDIANLVELVERLLAPPGS